MFASLFHRNHPDKQVVEISPGIVVFTVGLFLLLYFLWYIHHILTLLLLAFIIAVALSPVARKLQRRLRISALFAIVITYVTLVFSLGALGAVIIPPLAKELMEVLVLFELPALSEDISELKFTLSEISGLANSVGASLGGIFSLVSSTFNGVFTIVTLFITSFYIMLERKDLYKKLSWITSDKTLHAKLDTCLNSIEEQLGGWVRAEVSLMTTIGMVTYAGLLIFQIPYALPLAVLAGLLEILPNLGPTISAVPAIFIAYITHGWLVALAILVMYIIIQQVENSILVPKVMSHRVHVSPLTVIVVILIGLEVGGVIGALLSVPVYIIVRTVYGIYFKDMVRSLR